MQSTKIVFKRLGSLLQAPLLSSRLSSSLAVQCNSLRNPQNMLLEKFRMPFSTTAQIIEEKEHSRSETRLLSEEFNLIIRSPKFNKNIVIHTIEKYLKHAEKSRDANFIPRTLGSQEFKDFSNYIVNHLNSFQTPEELANIALFLLSTSRNNNRVIESLISYIKSYDKLLAIQPVLLKEIFEKLFINNYENHKSFLDSFLSKMKANKASIDINNYVSLLDSFNKFLNKNRENIGKQSEEFEKIFSGERDYILQNLSKITTPNLATVYEFIFEEEPNENWASLVKTIEGRIIEDHKSLNSEQITKIAYILYWLQRDSHELWTILEKEVIAKIETFTSNNLVTLLGCFSSMGFGSDDLYMHLDRQLGFMYAHVKPAELAPMVYCFAESGKFRKKFFFLFSERIAENVSLLSPSDLVRTLWAYTVTNTLNESLYRLLEKNIAPVVEKFDNRELGLLLECLIAINEPHESILTALVPRLEQTFKASKNYQDIEEDVAIKVYLFRAKSQNDLDHLFPLVDKYLLYKLQDSDISNIQFILSLGSALGENIDLLRENNELFTAYINRLEKIQQLAEELLDSEQAEQVKFLLVNLKGLATQ